MLQSLPLLVRDLHPQQAADLPALPAAHQGQHRKDAARFRLLSVSAMCSFQGFMREMCAYVFVLTKTASPFFLLSERAG